MKIQLLAVVATIGMLSTGNAQPSVPLNGTANGATFGGTPLHPSQINLGQVHQNHPEAGTTDQCTYTPGYHGCQ